VMKKFIGDAVNTAARVRAVAGSGLVLVDGATRLLAERGAGFAAAIGEARYIACRVRCQPLLDRAADFPPQNRGSGPRW
jgi:class 3 adenylate cyclase